MEQKKIKTEGTNKVVDFLYTMFGRLWALWGFVSFVVSFLIIFLPSMVAYLIPGKKGQDYFIWVSRCWMQSWLYLVGCPVKVRGKENFKKGETYVIVYNHNALIDVPLSAPFVPGANKTIAKSSFAKVPIFGWFYKRGSVLVDRKNDQSRRKSLDMMRSVLQQNIHMCIYPEGTRNRTDQPLKPFYDGAFKLAIDAKKEVMPCIIFGTKEAMPISKGFYFIPKRLEIHFLPTVSFTDSTPSALKDKVFDIMKDYYVKGVQNVNNDYKHI
jgi:1-acyl-sn-glycerol-3-phosphate acyltransferase